MQFYPCKIYTALVSSFVARTTRFNSGVYLYCYNPPIVTKRQGHQDQSLTKYDLHIELPRDLPTSRDTREPPIDQASDVLIELPISQEIPRPIDFPEDEPNPSL